MKRETPFTSIIIGSGGGIGLALKEKLLLSTNNDRVICYSKSNDNKLDVTVEKQIYNAAEELKKKNIKVNLLINAIGYLHEENHSPEKRVSEINSNYLLNSFKINTIGHALIIKYFSPLMDHGSRSVLACLSARVGSIEDNYLGGWFAYRSSKAALNQMVKSTSIEFARKKSNLILIAIHPGTVLTKLSKPFIKKPGYLTTNQSANYILNVISKLNNQDSGGFLDYKGIKIPY